MKISRDEILTGTKVGFRATFLTKLGVDEIKASTTNLQSGFLYGDSTKDGLCVVKKNLDGTTEIQTPLFGYVYGIVNLSRILTWISLNGKTNDSCFLKITVGYADNMEKLYKLNICKFVLGFDENKFYNVFNTRNMVGCLSIKTAMPTNITDGEPNAITLYNNYSSVDTSRYGVCFNGLKDNLLTFGYIGRSGYEKKQMEINNLLSYFAVYAYTTLVEPEYTIDDIAKIKELNEKCKEVINGFESYKNFKKAYKNIKVSVDLYDMDGQEEIYWNKLRDNIYRLVVNFFAYAEGNAVELNYDTDESVFQIRGANVLGSAFLNGVDVVESNLVGTYGMCTMLSCNIESANLNYCKFMSECKITDSVISNSYVGNETVCENCTIVGDSTICGKMVSCKIENGVKYTEDAVFKKCKKDNLTKV